MEPDTTFAMSPSTTRNDTTRTLQSGAEGCSLRSACDFCHSKRIKCVTTEGQSRCEPCIRRNGPCNKSFKRKTGPKPTRSTPNHDVSEGRRRKRMRSSRREVINSSSGEDISTHSGKETTYHSFSTPELLLTQEQGAGVAFDFDWREGNGGSCNDSGNCSGDGSDAMAASCGDPGGDLVGGVIDSMADEETAKFVESLGARIIQIEDESASHKGIVEEEGARCDDMAALSDDRGGDPLGGVIDSMTGEEANKFILGLVARIKQIEEESASHEGIADKGA